MAANAQIGRSGSSGLEGTFFFSHMDTGALVEDILTWLKQIVHIQQRQGEQLPQFQQRSMDTIKAFNFYLAKAGLALSDIQRTSRPHSSACPTTTCSRRR
jgi:hypothetical protein